MPQSSQQVTKKIWELSNGKFNHLDLQRVLYICEMIYIGRYRERLINGHFEAWDYGPIQPDVFKKLHVFGSKPVGNLFNTVPDLRDDDIVRFLKEVLSMIDHFDSSQLVGLANSNNGAWAWNYNPDRAYCVIPKEHIAQEYDRRFKQPPKEPPNETST